MRLAGVFPRFRQMLKKTGANLQETMEIWRRNRWKSSAKKSFCGRFTLRCGRFFREKGRNVKKCTNFARYKQVIVRGKVGRVPPSEGKFFCILVQFFFKNDVLL